jgi:SAM-dependent methyltransferase
MQAPFYARSAGVDLEARLAERVQERFRPGARLLVVGSGSGRECFGLARAGYEVVGIDFSPTMVRLAREAGARLGLEVEFVVGDVQRHALPRASFAGALFTYDFYGLIPGRAARVALLRRLGEALAPGGAVFLSARRLRHSRDRVMLTLEWLAGRRRGSFEWGMSHTRWIGADGGLQRAFMHVFSPRGLAGEIRAAGFAPGAWEGGHMLLEPQLPPPRK